MMMMSSDFFFINFDGSSDFFYIKIENILRVLVFCFLVVCWVFVGCFVVVASFVPRIVQQKHDTLSDIRRDMRRARFCCDRNNFIWKFVHEGLGVFNTA